MRMKKIALAISGGVSFLVFLILLFLIDHLADAQAAQNAANRWDKDGDVSQISCFFSVNARVSEDSLISFEHTIEGALTDAGVSLDKEKQGARLWVDAYSADGTITLTSDKTRLNADAIGIGGDFFLLHPMTLLDGSFFSGNEVNSDYCVIDEDAAWQLFGSNYVSGMTVFIGNRPHIVTGVVRRPGGRLAEAAGLDGTLVYVSYKTLKEYGRCNGINHYEIVMPNPVSGFAQDYVKENLGGDEKETEVIENTSRYSLLSRLKMIRSFGTRAMNGKAIIYPYWENMARGWEDILALMTLFELLFLVYAAVLALVFFIRWQRHKGWTIKSVFLKLKDKAERLVEKLRMKRREKRENGERKDREIEKKSRRGENALKKEKRHKDRWKEKASVNKGGEVWK